MNLMMVSAHSVMDRNYFLRGIAKLLSPVICLFIEGWLGFSQDVRDKLVNWMTITVEANPEGEENPIPKSPVWVDAYAIALYTFVLVVDFAELWVPRAFQLQSRVRTYGRFHQTLVHRVNEKRAFGFACWMNLSFIWNHIAFGLMVTIVTIYERNAGIE